MIGRWATLLLQLQHIPARPIASGAPGCQPSAGDNDVIPNHRPSRRVAAIRCPDPPRRDPPVPRRELWPLPHRARFARGDGRPRRCLLGHPHRAGAHQLPDLRHANLHLPRSDHRLRLRQTGRRAREFRPRGARRGPCRHDRAGSGGHPGGSATGGVCRRHPPGRGRHLDQHERQRGDRQSRAGARRLRKGRLRAPPPARPCQSQPEHERHVSHGVQDRAPLGRHPAARRARPAGGIVRGQGRGVCGHPQDRPHPVAGCRANDARPGVRQLRHHAPGGSQRVRGPAALPAGDEPPPTSSPPPAMSASSSSSPAC